MFEEKDLLKLSKLCHIQMDDKEKVKFLHSLNDILAYVQQLKELDTTSIPACHHVLENMTTVMRDDDIGETLPRETFLSNAPDQIGGMIRVPPILKFD